MVRLLVCGGRAFEDEAGLFRTLDGFHDNHPVDLVIEGGACGADVMAGRWAEARGITHRCFEADWKRYRSAAGPIRNRQMLEEGRPDLVMAFPGGKGTANMVEQAREAGVEVLLAVPDSNGRLALSTMHEP
ncbi:MAG: DUF2493 domain-containing protein [Rhodospirillales bacterium]